MHHRIFDGLTKIVEPGRRNLVPGGSMQEVQAVQQQSVRDSGCSLLSNLVQAFLKEQANHISKNRDRKQCNFLQSEKRAAAASLSKLADRIQKIAEELNISILDYRHLDILLKKEEIMQKASMMLKMKPIQDNQAIAQDCLSNTMYQETPYNHPPIPLIQSLVNKVNRKRTTTVIVVPYWPVQPLWPSMMKIVKKFIVIGEIVDVLKMNRSMRKQKKYLPLVRRMIAMIEWTEENHYSEGFYNKEGQTMKQFKELLMAGLVHGGDIGCEKANFRSSCENRIRQRGHFGTANANQTACNTAVGILLELQAKKINKFALKQIMKKSLIQVAKELREEPICGLNKLLNFVKQKVLNIKFLSEKELMGIVISVMMGFSTLRLTKIHRASVEMTK
ncbi:MAG: hypothetical protein EZS28_006134 [Streblomastix strix]|uniref:Uncharacterized protein n=1 Tax=Streblomastix strix TaxID=222440 RepID=A0A5J4WTN2_9EUKA|nr:MAG: hypothetical protein EZS28_006134 [Streblomastix strix]